MSFALLALKCILGYGSVIDHRGIGSSMQTSPLLNAEMEYLQGNPFYVDMSDILIRQWKCI